VLRGEAATFERAIPHASGDFGSVRRIVPGLQRLVECQCVQDHGVVKRSDETVHLTTEPTSPVSHRWLIANRPVTWPGTCCDVTQRR